jgi:uncharacterized protein (TIGR03382 family)
MKKFIFFSAALVAPVLTASAVNILSPGDPIIGGRAVGANFEVGVAGTAAGVNNWPAGEPPQDLINGLMGGGNEKYLNFAQTNTGVIVTPNFAGGSPTVVTGFTLFVANDAVERDPAEYQLWGTSVPIAGGGPFPISDFTLIWEDPLALPDTRDTVADGSGFSQTVTFGNTTAYTSYMLLFPSVKNPLTANSMQISEWLLDGTAIPEPGTAMLAGLAVLSVLRRRRK